MNWSNTARRPITFPFMLLLSLSLLTPTITMVAKRRPIKRISIAPSEHLVALFAEFNREVAKGGSLIIPFSPTDLNPRAEAIAQVVIRDQTLFVRMQAKNLSPPALYNADRYTLWAYQPNYSRRIYIGDLPIVLPPRRKRRLLRRQYAEGDVSSAMVQRTDGGTSDTVYRFTAWPRDAHFGGLVLTTEPAHYVPVAAEPLRPVLTARTSEEIKNTTEAIAAAGPAPPETKGHRDVKAAPARGTTRRVVPKRSRTTSERHRIKTSRRRAPSGLQHDQ